MTVKENSATLCAPVSAVDVDLVIIGQLSPEYEWRPLKNMFTTVKLNKTAAKPTIDVPFIHLDDAEGLAEETRRAKTIGFHAKAAIHPAQIEAIVAAMRPDHDETAAAAEILCAAQDADWGPIRHRDRLHDRASYRYYWDLLRRAQATGCALPDAATHRFF